MRSPRHDWLDSLARRSAEGVRTTARVQPRPLPDRVGGPGASRVDRRSALKLALAGAASLSLGLGKIPVARAETRDDCIGRCYQKYVDAAERDIATCNHFYAGAKDWNGGTAWGQFKRLVDQGAWKFVKDVTNESLRRTCIHKAENTFKKGLDKCDDACTETCGPRSLQSASSAAGPRTTCHGTSPPPTSPPPQVPPAPNPADDPCAACATVGGLCCGPAPLGKPPCGCAGYFPADGSDPCKRLGC